MSLRSLVEDTKWGQTQYDLAGTDYLYVGYADPLPDGTARTTAEAVWTIRRITLTAGSPTASQWTAKGQAVWDNRVSESYI